jgi:ABC-type phosphate transport system substrate-binding protein
MQRLTTRWLTSACLLSALAAMALAAPGVASAEPGGTQCSGEDIEGKGASLQKLAQQKVWTPAFKAGANPLACSGTQGTKEIRTVGYNSVGSGKFLESWGQETKTEAINFGPKNAYGGTDEPPSPAQKKEIETQAGGGTVLTIPVMQAAVTVSVHLPANCTVTGGPAGGRLALKLITLEHIFRGVATQWKEVLNGAKLTGTGCETKGTTHITRVVREDGSGTTSLFKKFLNVVFGKEIEPGQTWKTLAEKAHNTTWPNEGADPVERGNGNGGVATKIETTAGSIGYVNLADARANKSFTKPTGGSGMARFWVKIENGKGTYADPSTNEDGETAANANCLGTLYINGKKKFPPPTVTENWNEVSASKSQKNYPICGFTYDLSLTKFSAVKGSLEAPTEKSVRTAFDYLNFVLAGGAEGGQTQIGENKDYLGLPESEEASKNVLKIARDGVKKIGF